MKNDEWREKYLIGITEIDDDHQHLFDVIAMEVSELILNKDKVQTYFSTKNIFLFYRSIVISINNIITFF